MSRFLAAALMGLPGIKAAVPDAVPVRRALGHLPPGAELPAIVYSVISIVPDPYVDDPAGLEAMRLQVNPLALTVGQVQQIHDAVQATLDGLADQHLAGRRVVAIRRDVAGPADDTTDDAGSTVWTWPRDYIVVYE